VGQVDLVGRLPVLVGFEKFSTDTLDHHIHQYEVPYSWSK